MTRSWTLAALLGTALLVGCADREPQDTENVDENEAAAPSEPGAPTDPPAAQPPASSAGQDTPTARPPAQGQTATSRPPASQTLRDVTVPAGTALPLELMTALSSETAKVETPVRARLRQAIQVDDAIVFPAGAVLSGTVIEAQQSGRVQGRARLAFRFDTVEVDGARGSIATNPVIYEAQGTAGEDAAKVGVGAVGGAIVGSILGGGSGAARGAAIGGAAGAGVVLATRGEEVELAEGTSIAATLAEPYEGQVR